ncbi:MAG TPA: MBL fold metallo-hydrolase [Longimicrobiales bacterium]|nr:MBL fold metallo-hydrolase [Longimicrobiales bacterium]
MSGPSRPTLSAVALLLLLATVVPPPGPAAAQAPPPADPPAVSLTWLSITSWLVEFGDTRLLLDGYLTRIDRRLTESDGTSHGSAVTDTAELRRLLVRAVPDLRLDWILVGHGHWDHAFDVPAIARMTGARIAGPRTVCHQAAALGLDPGRCVPVEGGEVLEPAGDLKVRVVRWHHSGDPATDAGRRLSAPLELRAPPPVDVRTGGLRPGFLEDYPNGGGSRAYLITLGRTPRATTLFWSNTGNPAAWDTALAADTAFLRAAGVDLSNLAPAGFARPTRDLLAATLRAEGLGGVDLWIGFPGAAHVRQVVPVLRPGAFIPHHWDDFWTPMSQGIAEPFAGDAIRPYLDSAGVALVPPVAYYQRMRPVGWRAPGSYDAGVVAGIEAAGSAGAGGDFLRLAAGAGGGFLAGAMFRFPPVGTAIAAGGLSLVIVAGEAGPARPPLDLTRRARESGPDYADGFADGFAERRRTAGRRAAWIGGGLGAAAGITWVVLLMGRAST